MSWLVKLERSDGSPIPSIGSWLNRRSIAVRNSTWLGKQCARMNRLHFFATIFAFTMAGVPLRAAPPQLAHYEPLALVPGKTIELTINGQYLQDPRSLWTTFAARCDFVSTTNESAKKGERLLCHVTVPRDEQVGIGALRVVTGEGVSNPVLVMLDDLPTVAEASDNHTIEQAQSIALPIAVDGQCDALHEDVFRFHARPGQRVSFEVVSQRLGSKLDPVLRLMKVDGKEISRFDDAESSGGDTRFEHTFDADGDYLLALGDVRHAGGNEYRYRLRIGSFSLISAAYPLGGQSGAVMSFELVGRESDPLAKLNVALPDTLNTRRLVSFGVPSADGAGSGWFQVEAGPESESLEREPNDSVAEATSVQFPGVLNGRFDKPGDRDYFKFKAQKGQRLHCVARSRELGSACDVYMRLHKADGSKIADARQERQTVLDFDVPEDGEYVLQVEDLLVGGVPKADHVYRIHLDNAYSGFSLHTEGLQYSAPQGGTFVVKVLARRTGYNGPIELAVEGLGEGVKLEGNTISDAETLLKITLPTGIPAGEVRNATIVGKAKVGEQTVTVPANEREPLRSIYPNAFSLPTQMENTIAIGVAPAFPPFFDLSVASPQLYFPQLVGTSSFDVNISRTNAAFKDAVSLVIEGLPKGITAEIAPVDDGSKALRVSLKGPKDLPEGEFPVRIIGTGKFQDQNRAVVLENLKLRITKPLVVSVSMAGPILAGGQQQAEVQLQRFGADPQAVRVHVSDGPEGLAAPIFVTISGDASQAKIPFTAAATAKPGKFNNLVVVASTTVAGQNVTVRNKPASVEIQPPK